MIAKTDAAFRPVREHNCLNFFAFAALSRLRPLSISSIPAMKQTNAFEGTKVPGAAGAARAGFEKNSDTAAKNSITFMAYKMMGGGCNVKSINIVF